MVARRSQGNWRWEGPLGTPLGLVHWKRASSPVEAGTALGGDLHLRDLIKKDGPAIRQFKASQPPFGSARKGSFLVAEDLTLQQRLRNSSAVDRDEGTVLAGGEIVNRARCQLFSGAAPSPDEDRRSAGRCQFKQPVDLSHGSRVANQRAEPA